MNDPYEGFNSKLDCSRQNVFATCWTAEERDELPMWNLYNQLQGVRIKMPIDMFNHEKEMMLTKISGSNNFLIKSNLNKEYQINRYPIDPKIAVFMEKSFPFNSVYGPTKIEYVNSSEEIEANHFTSNDLNKNFQELHMNLIGQKKVDHWEFEKEHRYRVFFANGLKIAGTLEIMKEILENSPVKTEFIDIELKEKSFENFEILLGPKTGEKEEEYIKNILIKYNLKNAQISKSKIRIQ